MVGYDTPRKFSNLTFLDRLKTCLVYIYIYIYMGNFFKYQRVPKIDVF